MHRIRRPGNIVRRKIWLDTIKLSLKIGVVQRNLTPAWAALPNTHHPDHIGAPGRNFVNYFRGNTAERYRRTKALTQVSQPDPGVDLIDGRVAANRHNLVL